MKVRRNNRGASMIAIMIAFVFFFVILGAGIYGYIFLTGSQKSLQEATDAGAINVAKQAMSGVYASLSVGASPSSYFDAAMTPVLGSNNLNLYGYNKAVARALMVALNAVDMQNNDAKSAGVDLSSNGALAQAQALISRLQGGPTSIGGQLQTYLTTGVDGNGSPWAQQAFNQIANNPLSSLGLSSAAKFDSSQFAAAYFTGTGESTAVAPVADQLASSWTPPGGAVSAGDSALIGYGSGIAVGGMTVIPVPADPTQAPHLISLSNFADPSQTWKPGSSFVPPNAFKIGAASTDVQTKANTYAKAAALVGGLPSVQSAQSMFANATDLLPQIKQLIAYLGTQPAYAQSSTSGVAATTASIAGGYVLLDNSNAQTPTTINGAPPGTDNVFSDELGIGITVDDTTSMFSDNGAVQNWQSFAHTPPAAGVAWDPAKDPLVSDPKKVPSVSGLYNADGSAATVAQAGAIPYGTSPAPPTSLCTDQNSDSADPNSDPECVKLASPPSSGGLDPFDVAYHPNANAGANTSTPSGSRTAAEVAKMMVAYAWEPVWSHQWPQPYVIPLSTVRPTGMRLWPHDKTPDRQKKSRVWPYAPNDLFGYGQLMQDMGFGDTMLAGAPSWSDPNVTCKISHDGTIYQLFHQIDPSDAGYNDFVNVAATRVMQMGAIGATKGSMPGAAAGTIAAQLDGLFRSTKMPLGSRKYLFLQQQADASTGKQTMAVVINDQGPDWLAGLKATTASQALRSDLLNNLDSLQNSPASQWNSSGLTPAGATTGAVQLDGVWNTACSHAFNGVDTIINPIREWNIHDQLFTQSGNATPGNQTVVAQVTVTETAAYQKTSGAYGLLGVLKFQEAVSGEGTEYFWAPN